MKKLALFTALAVICQPVAADEADADKRNWSAAAELGFNVTSGNSDTQSLKTRLEFNQDLESWATAYNFDALRKKDNEVESANKWLLTAKGNYKLQDKTAYLTVGASREEDEYGVYDNYNKVNIGYGKRLYKTQDIVLSADIGPGYAFYEHNATGISDNSAIVNMSGLLKWKVSQNANFSQKLTIEQGLNDEKNTKTRSESALAVSINGSLKMKLAYTVLNNTEVQPGTKKTDTETSVTLVYAF